MTDFSDDEISNVVRTQFGSGAAARATANIDVDPDQTARAYELEKVTGIPAGVISGDLDSFESQTKAGLAGQIINKNKYIADYVQRHPLASQISNDDYGQLNEVSGWLQKLEKFHTALSPWMNHDQPTDPLKGFKETGEIGSWIPEEDRKNFPVLSQFFIDHAMPVELTLKGLMGATLTAADQISESSQMFDPIFGKGFGKEVGSVAEAELMGLTGRTHIPSEIGRKIGEVHNQAVLDVLDKAVESTQSSMTHARSPDLFHDEFVKQHLNDAKMEVSGQAALALYGEKAPEFDDGLLGWVPNIKEQLDNARETGADITVPMSEWVSKVDPEVHKALHDDLRVVPWGVTAREVVESATQIPTPHLDDPVSAIRAGTGLEPMFAMGDRKLTLQRLEGDPTSQFGPSAGFHDFDMINEKGESVGTINLSQQGKKLYVEMINGIGEYYHPNKFGPSLVRSLIQQIKAEFPDAEVLTGHRVSGAREAVGDMSGKSAFPEIDLANPKGWEVAGGFDQFSKIADGAWMEAYPGLDVYTKPTELWNAKEAELIQRVDDELARITPRNKLTAAPVSDIRRASDGASPLGYFQPAGKANKQAIIAYSLNSGDPLGIARHESIHALRKFGLFTSGEWSTLAKASRDEGWFDRFGIKDRYGKLSEEKQTEEAIAEGFRHWMTEKDQRAAAGAPKTLIDQIFEKLENFLEKIKDHVRQILGKEPTFEDLFKAIDQGDIAGRSREANIGTEMSKPSFMEPPLEPGSGTDVVPPFKAANEVGMTIPQYQRYMKLIEERQKADLAKSSQRILKSQEKRQTEKWKADSEAMRPQVVADMNARPDIAADKFLANSELFGKKLDNSYKLDRESVDPIIRKSLPDDYFTGRQGVKPDEVAHLFGYATGDQMVTALARYNDMRKASGLGKDRFTRSLVNMEIARRMEMEHGFLEKNIMEEAKDQILSENQLDILHEEMTHLAQMAGSSLGNITRGEIMGQLKDKFDNLPMRVVDSNKWLREAGKQGRAAEMGLLAGKPAEAFQAKQIQYTNIIYATFAKEAEKARGKLDKAAKAFRKAEPPRNIEPEYLNHIQNLLQQAGYKVGRSVENIQENLARQGKDVMTFANDKFAETWGMRDMPIADVIVNGAVKDVDSMTTHDFLGFKQTIDALIKNAKDEQKIFREGETADRKALLDDMRTTIEDRFEANPSNTNLTSTRIGALTQLPKSMLASITSKETFFNRMGGRDPNSTFNRYIVYPLAAAANRKSKLQREFSQIYRSFGELEDKDKLVQSPLTDPRTGQLFTRFTRGNVMQMIRNAGNRSNWNVLAQGYGADPKVLMDWLVANSTKEMWERAQKEGDDLYGPLVKLADNEYEHIHGITIDKVPLSPITNVHGTFDGWYHPLVKAPDIEGKAPIRGGAYDDANYGHITTANGYTKKRTGASYPVDLNPDMMPVRINQQIHDISFRSVILETQKLFRDAGLSNTITSRYGAEYNGRNFLLPYLRDIAGQESIPAQAIADGNRVSEFLRQNVIGTYIGFNPGTVFKHGPTALWLSMRQVGPANFLRAVKDLYQKSPDLGLLNHEFAMQWSEELQRRERHWQDTLFGAHSEIQGAKGFRENIIQAGSWAVAKSDMFSAKPTWLAAYRAAREGEIEGGPMNHGPAIDYADSQVRFAHGTTAVTNQPGIVLGTGATHKWMTSVYGFFGTMMQRRLEMAHDISDTIGLVKDGEIRKAAGNVPGLLWDTMAYVVWPTMVEEMVTGISTDDHRGWGTHLASATFLGLSSSVLFLRDIAHAISTGQEANIGLLPSAVQDFVKGVGAPFKKNAWSNARMGKTVGDTLTAFGVATGMAPKTVNNSIRFGIDLVNNTAHPKSFGDWYRGAAKGTEKLHKEK